MIQINLYLSVRAHTHKHTHTLIFFQGNLLFSFWQELLKEYLMLRNKRRVTIFEEELLTLLTGSARIHLSQSPYNPGWESVYIWCWPKWPKWFQSWYFISLVISKKCYLKIVLLYNIRQISSVVNALEDSLLIPKPAQAGKADCSVHGSKLYCRAVFKMFKVN